MKVQVMHGLSRHPLYFVWKNMIRRCSIPTANRYERYGGRGIIVCQEWHSVTLFIDWAEKNGWIIGLQLDRINNDGNYCPTNCRFVTVQENTRHRRTSKLSVEIVQRLKADLAAGNHNQSEIARIYNISPVTVCEIAKGYKWSDVQ
jgi:hypothetical protein